MDLEDIIVIGQQRTGSNLLCHAMSHFNNYRNINEFYSMDNNSFVYDMYFTSEEKEKFFQIYETRDWRTLLQKIHSDPVNSFNILKSVVNYQNTIIKLLDFHLDKNKELYSVIDESNKFIILNRTNNLEQYVSLKIAEEHDIWGADSTNNYKIHLDIDDYRSFCNNKKVFYKNLEEKLKNKNCLKINYENELSNGITPNLLDKLQKFLKTSPTLVNKNINGVWKKQRTIECSKQILNYNDIKGLLK